MSTPIKKKLSKLINLGSGRTLAGKIIPHGGCESLQVAKCNEILHPVTPMKFKTSKLVLKVQYTSFKTHSALSLNVYISERALIKNKIPNILVNNK